MQLLLNTEQAQSIYGAMRALREAGIKLKDARINTDLKVGEDSIGCVVVYEYVAVGSGSDAWRAKEIHTGQSTFADAYGLAAH